MICRLIDEWGAIDVNKTVVLNHTLCGIFPQEYCPSGTASASMRQAGSTVL
jgi:hypothetical protein